VVVHEAWLKLLVVYVAEQTEAGAAAVGDEDHQVRE
jgi:hypothetical protein